MVSSDSGDSNSLLLDITIPNLAGNQRSPEAGQFEESFVKELLIEVWVRL